MARTIAARMMARLLVASVASSVIAVQSVLMLGSLLPLCTVDVEKRIAGGDDVADCVSGDVQLVENGD